MQDLHTSTVARLVRAHLGDEIGAVTLAALNMTPALLSDEGERVSRASMATALGAALFRTVLDGVPSAAGYVGERLKITK